MDLPDSFQMACVRWNCAPTEHCLFVNIAHQKMLHFHKNSTNVVSISSATRGTGQNMDSLKTPLGLHRILKKIGENEPVGTIFKARKAIAVGGKGNPKALITDRILWLDGLEPKFNKGGNVDSHKRYIYIHGVGDESHLGRPNSRGCIHVAAAKLIPLFDQVSIGTLVYISEN